MAAVTPPRTSPQTPRSESSELPPPIHLTPARHDSIRSLDTIPPENPNKEEKTCWQVFCHLVVSFFESIIYFFKWLFCLLEDTEAAANSIAADIHAQELNEEGAATTKDIRAKKAFINDYPLTDNNHESNLIEIFRILGTTTEIALALKEGHLQELGKKISPIHPLRNISWIFRYYPDFAHLDYFQGTVIAYRRYVEEFSKTLRTFHNEKDADKFYVHLKGFCQFSDLHPSYLVNFLEPLQKGQTIENREALIDSMIDEHTNEELSTLWAPLFSSLDNDGWETLTRNIFQLLFDKRIDVDAEKKAKAENAPFTPKIISYPFREIEGLEIHDEDVVDIFAQAAPVTLSDDLDSLLRGYKEGAPNLMSNHNKLWDATRTQPLHPLRWIYELFTAEDPGTLAFRIHRLQKIFEDTSMFANAKEHFLTQFRQTQKPTEDKHIEDFCTKLSLDPTTITPLIQQNRYDELFQNLITAKAPQPEETPDFTQPLSDIQQQFVTNLLDNYIKKITTINDDYLADLWGPLKFIHPLRLIPEFCKETNRQKLREIFSGMFGNAKDHFLRNFKKLLPTSIDQPHLSSLSSHLSKAFPSLQFNETISSQNWPKLFEILAEKPKKS